MTPSGIAPDNNESYYRLLCEHVGVALIATDTDLNIRSWNAEATRMFGAATDRMIGTPIVSILPTERREEAERLLTQAMHSRDTYEFEFQYGDAKGRHREASGTHLSASESPTKAAGRPLEMALFIWHATVNMKRTEANKN